MKPIRMLTSMDKKQLKQHIEDTLNDWCQQYALMDVGMLICDTMDDSLPQALVNQSHNTSFLLANNWLSFWTEVLFGCDDDSFHVTTKKLIMSYFESIIREPLVFDDACHGDSWQYFCSPAHSFCFQSKDNETMITLSPDTVQKLIGVPKKSALPLTPIAICVDDKHLSFDVECSLGTISLNDIKQLEAGDVIVSDIPIGSPIFLTHLGQKRAEVALGQQSGHKSIKIRSFL